MQINRFHLCLIGILTWLMAACNGSQENKSNTKVSIRGADWYINDTIINQGTPAEGLLMNTRMVNSIFEDRGENIPEEFKNFDPLANTEEFLSKIPEYASYGINAFTISLQGGAPGYEGAVNTAFNPDGSLRDEYMQRAEMVINECDKNQVVVNLSCFYQRQHSHFSALTGKESIKNALTNTVNWITEKKFTNVILEVSNEYRHGGYRNWTDGEWIMSEAGQVELIELAKQINPDLLVSTSGMGNGKLDASLIDAADYLLIHFNNTSLNDYEVNIGELKKYGKPVVCNEDDKVSEAGVMALTLSVMNRCGWGFMHSAQNQTIPFNFSGMNDDPDVYNMFKNATTRGFTFDPELYKQTFVIITSPNDGDIFETGQNLRIQISVMNPPDNDYQVKILANNNEVAVANERMQAVWNLQETGIFILEAVLTGAGDEEIFRSPRVDIIVK